MAGALTAVCIFLGALKGSEITLTQQGDHVLVSTHLTGVEYKQGESNLHGFHIHQRGDLGNKCIAAGPHYNPHNVTHGAPDAAVHHSGDLGNFHITGDHTYFNASYSFFTVEEVLDRAFVVHAGEDDLGLGIGDKEAESKKTGNAGARLDCCKIATSAPNAAMSGKLQDQVWILLATIAAATIASKKFAL